MSGDVINKDKPVLGYWKIRGLAQPIRLLLAYAGQEWEDKFYPDGSPPLSDQTEWLKDKFSFDMGYPNMPYYMEGNLKVSNSGAIMRYLGEKFSLLGATPDAMAMADMAYFELDDWRMQFLALFYIYYGEEDATERFLKMVQPKYLSRFARLLRDGREYIVGQEITYSDFLLYEMLEWSLFLDPKGLRTYSGLETFRRRIAELPEIKAYLESDRFIAWPLLAQPIRNLLEYVGADYQEETYPVLRRDQWTRVKESKGFDFPNLPFLIDGETKITQSGAILLYLARKHNLLGAREEERMKANMAYFELDDFRFAFYFATYGIWYDWVPESGRLVGWTRTKRDDWFGKYLPSFLKRSMDFLGDSRFIAGDSVTFADFLLYEVLDMIQYTDPTCLRNAAPSLWSYVKRFEALPPIIEYQLSPRYLRWPINCNLASFGYKAEDKQKRESVDIDAES